MWTQNEPPCSDWYLCRMNGKRMPMRWIEKTDGRNGFFVDLVETPYDLSKVEWFDETNILAFIQSKQTESK